MKQECPPKMMVDERVGTPGSGPSAATAAPRPPSIDVGNWILLHSDRRFVKWGCLVTSVFAMAFGGISVSRWAQIMESGASIGLVLQAIVCAVVGLAALSGLAASILSMLNPRAVVRVQLNRVPLGQGTYFAWSFVGSTRRIRNLTIALVGKEQAIWAGRGSKTSTAYEHVFRTVPLVETSIASEIAAGAGRLDMPLNVMHTFSARYNKVTWALRVRGTIPHWLHVREDFEIEVAPAAPPERETS